MMQLRTIGLAGLAAMAALLPLYGDPRSAPVTHPEWARMMLRGMDLEESLDATGSAAKVFSALSWRENLWLQGSQFEPDSDAGVQVQPGAGGRVVAVDELGEVSYPLTVSRRGEYRLRVRMAGNPATPAVAQITPLGQAEPEKTFTFVPGTVASWIDAPEGMKLKPGTYQASFALPRGTSLEQFEVAPPCVNAIEPVGGWKPSGVLRAEDLAVTILKAIEREHELPPADVPVELTGSDFEVDQAHGTSMAVSAAGGPEDGLWLRASGTGTQAVLYVDLKEAGLYAVSAFGLRGAGQQWGADSCRSATLCPITATAPGEAGEVPSWFPVFTAPFSAGPHFLAVTLAPGAAVQRVRLERKKDSAADYVATLKRLGFDAGEGPVSRGKAADALQFLTGRYASDVGRPCDEIQVAPEVDATIQAQLAPAAGAGGGGAQPPVVPPEIVTPPIGQPPVDPPPVVPPVTVPCVPPASPDEPNPCPPT